MSESLGIKSVATEPLKASDIDGANDRFALIRAQEGTAILRRYNASIAAVRAGLEKVPSRYRGTTAAAVQAYMKVAHDLWTQMQNCEKDFGHARRLQMDAQMRFAQSSKSFMTQQEAPKKGLMKRLFQRKSPNHAGNGVESRDLAMESAGAIRSAIDQQTDALMKHHFLQGEFERTLNEMAQIVQQHTADVHDREFSTPVEQALTMKACAEAGGTNAGKTRKPKPQNGASGSGAPVH